MGHARAIAERAEQGRGAQLRHPQEPARVRRRDERAAQDGLQDAPAAAPRPLQARDHRRGRQADRQDARDQAARAPRRRRRSRRSRDMVLHYGTPMPQPGEDGQPRAVAPKTVEEVEGARRARRAPQRHLPVLGRTASTSRSATRRSRKRSTSACWRRSRRASPSSASACSISSTASSARWSRSAARRTSRRRTGTGRASASGFIEHFGVEAARRRAPARSRADLAHALYEQAREARRRRRRRRSGTELFLRVFRHFYLEEIDRAWVEHLTNMEHLRDGIGLRGYGQRDPKQEYKKEGYDIFVNMMAATSQQRRARSSSRCRSARRPTSSASSARTPSGTRAQQQRDAAAPRRRGRPAPTRTRRRRSAAQPSAPAARRSPQPRARARRRRSAATIRARAAAARSSRSATAPRSKTTATAATKPPPKAAFT